MGLRSETFGHLAPKPELEYKGYILFTLTTFGDTSIIDFEFKGLEESPWFNSDVLDFISNQANEVGVYRYEGSYKKFKNGSYEFKGKIREIPLS